MIANEVHEENHPTSPPRILAVIVTFNRKDLLQRCLRSIQGQTRPPDSITVVDNASTDGTRDMLEGDFPEVDILKQEVNTGGAGGWAAAISKANGSNWDFIWLMDDDAWAGPDSLEQLIRASDSIQPKPSFVCSRVVDQNDRSINLPHPWLPASDQLDWDRYLVRGFLPIKAGSFVSMLIPGSLARNTSPPLAHYFLWLDDYEYSLRLSQSGAGWYVTTSIVNHPRAGGLAKPDIVQEPNPKRLWLYVHFFANYIETMARHPAHHPRWAWVSFRLVYSSFLQLIRARQWSRIKILAKGSALGYFRAICYLKDRALKK